MTLHSTLKNLDLEHGTFILTGKTGRTLYRMSDADVELIIQTMAEGGFLGNFDKYEIEETQSMQEVLEKINEVEDE